MAHAPACSSPSLTQARQQGFTLIEILLVVAIVGVMAGLATLNIQGDDYGEKLERETRKLAAQISLLQDEALVQSREFGVALWQNGYRFWGWTTESGWLPLAGDDAFKPQLLLENAELELSLVGQPVALEVVPVKGFPVIKPPSPSKGTSSASDSAPDFRQNLPAIVLFSSGEASSFDILLTHPDSDLRWKISGDIIGTLKISSEVVEQ